MDRPVNHTESGSLLPLLPGGSLLPRHHIRSHALAPTPHAEQAPRELSGSKLPHSMWSVALCLLIGCGETRTPTPTSKDIGPLTLEKAGPAGSDVELTPGQPFPRIEFAFTGGPGFAKQIVEVTGTAESKNAGAFVYDTLFRAQDVGRLRFDLIPNPPDATEPSQAKVRLGAESGGEDSDASYNPRLWFGPGHETTRIRVKIAEHSKGRPLKADEEIVLAEIVATPSDAGRKPIALTWKVQFSGTPSPPRLKAKRVGSPPAERSAGP